MIARIRKSMEEKDKGFTLVELLVVMIIIGILAAIAIPVFLNQRTKARETAAKADVSVIGKEVTAYYVDGAAGLSVSGGTATTAGTWTLVDTSGTPATIATGKLSMGDVASGTATSLALYCFTVTPSAGSAWSYGQNGLVKGGTC